MSWPASVAGVESAISHHQSELEKVLSISKSIMANIDGLNAIMKDAITFLENEIDLIFKWENATENVNNKIALFTVEELQQFADFQKMFVRGVDKLQTAAQAYLDQPAAIFQNIHSD